MGWSLSWAAVKDGKAEAIHSLLSLRATNVWESGIAGSALPTGWYLVWFDRKELGDRILKKLSRLGEVFYCFVEDHLMFSGASGWKDGNRLFCVTHHCEKGMYHLDIVGDAPPSLKDIHAKLLIQQRADGGEKAEVDHIYDAPAELAKDLTRFRHDLDRPGMKERPFEVLEETNFFSRVLGGKN